mgnify:CR=1 FL=1
MSMTETIVIRVPRRLKRKMKMISVDWPEYIRNAIRRKIREELMKAAASRLDSLRKKLPKLSSGTIAGWIREDREQR